VASAVKIKFFIDRGLLIPYKYSGWRPAYH
jgi:hypothetical protein